MGPRIAERTMKEKKLRNRHEFETIVNQTNFVIISTEDTFTQPKAFWQIQN